MSFFSSFSSQPIEKSKLVGRITSLKPNFNSNPSSNFLSKLESNFNSIKSKTKTSKKFMEFDNQDDNTINETDTNNNNDNEDIITDNQNDNEEIEDSNDEINKSSKFNWLWMTFRVGLVLLILAFLGINILSSLGI